MEDVIYIISNPHTCQDSLADSFGRIFETFVYSDPQEWVVQNEIYDLAIEYGISKQWEQAPGELCEPIKQLVADGEVIVHKIKPVR